MGKRIIAGIVGGLIAGLPFGVMMQMMTAPTPDGSAIPMMQMVAMVVRSTSVWIGWFYHLFNSAFIGAVFGALLGNRIKTYGAGVGWGALYGVAWWILGGQILMPLALGMPAFAALMMAPMLPVAIGSLIGHLVYGVLLGGFYVALTLRIFKRQAATSS